jgi:hypothetical protein
MSQSCARDQQGPAPLGDDLGQPADAVGKPVVED